jgi:hypothetical protein
MIFYFHVDECKILIIRVLAVFCGFFLLVACGVSKTEKNCVNTAKENSDMKSEMDSSARNTPPHDALAPAPVGQETAIFGMG